MYGDKYSHPHYIHSIPLKIYASCRVFIHVCKWEKNEINQANMLKNKRKKPIYLVCMKIFIVDKCFDDNILPAYKFFYLELF